jgi:hypothetical protein
MVSLRKKQLISLTKTLMGLYVLLRVFIITGNLVASLTTTALIYYGMTRLRMKPKMINNYDQQIRKSLRRKEVGLRR